MLWEKKKECQRITEESLKAAFPQTLVWVHKSELSKESRKQGCPVAKIGPCNGAGGKVYRKLSCVAVFFCP